MHSSKDPVVDGPPILVPVTTEEEESRVECLGVGWFPKRIRGTFRGSRLSFFVKLAVKFKKNNCRKHWIASSKRLSQMSIQSWILLLRQESHLSVIIIVSRNRISVHRCWGSMFESPEPVTSTWTRGTKTIWIKDGWGHLPPVWWPT